VSGPSKQVTLNLREAYKAARWRRGKRALKIIREKVARITKSERIKISEEVSNFIHGRSIERPPRKITIVIEREEDGGVIVRLGGGVAAKQDADK